MLHARRCRYANTAIEGVRSEQLAALTGEIGDLRENYHRGHRGHAGAFRGTDGAPRRRPRGKQPLALARTATAGGDLDTLLKDQAIQRTMAAAAGALEDVHGMSTERPEGGRTP